jgi:hypothetical protein
LSHFKSKKNFDHYGQLIVNFANAQNSDEAIISLINGTKKIFNFSQSFVKQAQNDLPLLRKFKSSLIKPEKILIRSIIVEESKKGFLRSQFELLNLKLEGYDSEKETLVFREMTFHASLEEKEIDGEIEYSKPFAKPISQIGGEEWKQMKPWTLGESQKLIKIGRIKTKFRKQLTRKRYTEIKRLAREYQSIMGIHTHINQWQADLKNTLNEIVDGINLSDSKSFRGYLARYNIYCNLRLTLKSDGLFDHYSEIMEENYYQKKQEIHGYRKTFAYQIPVVFSFVEFLKHPKNRKLIRKCPYCNNFFIAKDIKRKKCYSNNCIKEYEKLKKRKQREGNLSKYY